MEVTKAIVCVVERVSNQGLCSLEALLDTQSVLSAEQFENGS